MTPDAFIELVKITGLPLAILIFVLWTGAKGYWVFGWVYRELREDYDRVVSLADKGTGLAEEAIKTPPRRSRARTRRE